MISSTIFVRVVPADRDRGFILLVGYDKQVVQRTAIQQISISVPTRDNLDAALDRVKRNYNASSLFDATAPGIVKRLAKVFGEVPVKAVKE